MVSQCCGGHRRAQRDWEDFRFAERLHTFTSTGSTVQHGNGKKEQREAASSGHTQQGHVHFSQASASRVELLSDLHAIIILRSLAS